MHDLINTKWLLENKEGGTGWTIYPGIIYPLDILSFQEFKIHNRNIPTGITDYLSYKLEGKEIIVEDGKWEIESQSNDRLILRCFSYRFTYKSLNSIKYELGVPNLLEVGEILSRGIWKISNETDNKSSNIGLFLNEKLNFSPYIPFDYYTFLKIGYHNELLASAQTSVVGWKIVLEDSIIILSLFDYMNSFQHLILSEYTKDIFVFRGEKELRIKKLIS